MEVGGTGEPLPVGEHKIEISVADGGGKRVCSDIFVLKIIDERLAENDLLITEWIHFDCIAEQRGCEMFSENFYKACGEYFRTAVKYGQTMILTPLFTFPLDTEIGGERLTFQTVGVKADGGKYFFDFSELKKFIDFAFGCGFKYIEFSHLFTQWGAMHAPKVMASVDGAYRRLFGWDTDSAGEEYVGFLEAFLPKLAEFVEQNGLKGKCFIHLSDEPSADAMPRYRMLKDIVKKIWAAFPSWTPCRNMIFVRKGRWIFPPWQWIIRKNLSRIKRRFWRIIAIVNVRIILRTVFWICRRREIAFWDFSCTVWKRRAFCTGVSIFTTARYLLSRSILIGLRMRVGVSPQGIVLSFIPPKRVVIPPSDY